MLLTLNLPTYSQRHHSPFPTKTGAEKSRQLLTSFQWFCCQWRFRKFFSIFPGSSFFAHGFLGQKFGGWVDDIRTFPEVGVFFYRKISVGFVWSQVPVFWGPNAESWKKKREGPTVDAISAPTFLAWHFECACQMASKLDINRSWKRVKQSLDR